MAIRLKTTSSEGCCDCEAQVSACECSADCSLECRSKVGDATLCGHSEYTSPSVPPKKYRTRTISGTLVEQAFGGPPHYDPWCAGPVTFYESSTYSGTGLYNEDTCDVTNTLQVVVDGGAPSPIGMTTNFLGGRATTCGAGSVIAVYTEQPTFREYVASGSCADCAAAGYRIYSGTADDILSDEDTDQDAVDRTLAGIEDWTESDCLTAPAYMTERDAGVFNFAFRHQQSRVSWTAIIGRSYEITIRYYRRVLGSGGPFVFYSVEERLVLADAVDEVSDWIDTPNEAGWETRPEGCLIELQPA